MPLARLPLSFSVSQLTASGKDPPESENRSESEAANAYTCPPVRSRAKEQEEPHHTYQDESCPSGIPVPVARYAKADEGSSAMHKSWD